MPLFEDPSHPVIKNEKLFSQASASQLDSFSEICAKRYTTSSDMSEQKHLDTNHP